MRMRQPFGLAAYLVCLEGIVWRESLRFLHQRERFVSALVRPLVWLFIFAAGFRQTLGISIIPPYETYVLYEVYITPGLIAMIQLFNGMQSSLSMVYDREMGSMRLLLVSPAPRWFLLTSKLIAGVAVSILQVYAYLVIAYFWEIEPPSLWGYLTILPALLLSGLMLGALGMVLSSLIKQLENFAGVMNFVIFPMFFASSALYPLWRVQEGSPWLATVCCVQSLHPRGRTHPLRLLGQGRAGFARGGPRVHDRLSRCGGRRLRPCARHAHAARRMRKEHAMRFRALAAAAIFLCLSGAARAADVIRIAVQKTGTVAWEIAAMKSLGLDKAAEPRRRDDRTRLDRGRQDRAAGRRGRHHRLRLDVGRARAFAWRQAPVHALFERARRGDGAKGFARSFARRSRGPLDRRRRRAARQELAHGAGGGAQRKAAIWRSPPVRPMARRR